MRQRVRLREVCILSGRQRPRARCAFNRRGTAGITDGDDVTANYSLAASDRPSSSTADRPFTSAADRRLANPDRALLHAQGMAQPQSAALAPRPAAPTPVPPRHPPRAAVLPEEEAESEVEE